MDPVRKTITVKATPEHAFRVFTEGVDSWWPREHHIGTAQMKRNIIEGRPGGRCYSEQSDGTEAPWGSVLVWDPPKRVVLAWQITPQWKFQPDLLKSSEVEDCLHSGTGGHTRVEITTTGNATAKAPKQCAPRWVAMADGADCCASSLRQRKRWPHDYRLLKPMAPPRLDRRAPPPRAASLSLRRSLVHPVWARPHSRVPHPQAAHGGSARRARCDDERSLSGSVRGVTLSYGGFYTVSASIPRTCYFAAC